MVAQLAGNRSIFDVFHSEDRSRIFSFYRNKTFILKEGDQVHRGTMEPLEWANERPILWRITMDRDGKQESYEVSKVEGNILVKSDDGEQIFYRGWVSIREMIRSLQKEGFFLHAVIPWKSLAEKTVLCYSIMERWFW